MFFRSQNSRRDVRKSIQTHLLTLDRPPTHLFTVNASDYTMYIHSPAPEALQPIKDLLAEFDLPHSDLTPSHLEHFLVCEEGGEIAGVVGVELHGKAALLRSLAVRPTHRGNGIGARLVEDIEQHARQHSATDIYLLTTTASDYFQRRGYEVLPREELPPAIQETDEAAHLCPSSATCMSKPLGSPATETA